MTTTTTRELRDSTTLLGDHVALRERIAADGYVFFPQLIDRRMIDAVAATARACLQRAGWTQHSGDQARPSLPVRAVRMRDAFSDAGYRAILADPGFNAVPYASPLAAVMAQILGPAGFCYPLKIPRIVYPAAIVPRQPGNVVHKDYSAVQDMFTSWVPLGAVPTSLGGLAVSPGSQHSTAVRYRPLGRLEPGWLTTDYQPGDVLVFHCLTTHAALPNREERIRLSAEYRWQLADQPAPRRMVIGPNGREIGSRLFSQAPWWRPVPNGLRLFDGDGLDAGATLPAAPSRFVTFSNDAPSRDGRGRPSRKSVVPRERRQIWTRANRRQEPGG
jgi:hypothetical protein